MDNIFLLLFLPLLLLLSSSSPLCATYGRLEWVHRVKPALRADAVAPLGDMLVAESAMNTLIFIDAKTGKRLWQFALTDPATIYGTTGREILVVSGRWIHLLDPYATVRVWTYRMTGDEPTGIFFTGRGEAIVEYGTNKRDVIRMDTGAPAAAPPPKKSSKKKTAPGEDAARWPAAKISPRENPVAAAGVRWEAGKLLGDGWSFEGDGPLEETAVEWKGRILALNATGTVYALDAASGAEAGRVEAGELVDMRFWDERPEFIGNYSMSRLYASGERVYLAHHSAIICFKIVPYPAEIALRKRADATDKWALEKAIGLWESKDFDEAVVRFRQAVEVWPDSAPIRLFLGMAYAAVDQTDSAIAELEKALEIVPDDQDIVSNLVGNYVNKILTLNPATHAAEIEKIYQRLLTLHPTSKMGYIGYAELLLGSNRYDEAKAVILSARKYGFFGVDAFALSLTAQYLAGYDAGALETARDMKLYFPDAKNVSAIRGKIYCRAGKYAECMKHLRLEAGAKGEEEVSLFPFIIGTGAKFYYANAIGLTGKYREAIGLLKEYYDSLSKSPAKKQAETLEEQTALMLREAEGGYLVPTLFALAHFHFRLGEKAESMKYLKLIEESGEDDAEVKSFLGYFLALNGEKLEHALELTAGALEESGNSAVFLKNHAVALWKLKRYGEAGDYFRRALDTGEKVEFLRYDYGCMLLETGKRKEGKEQIKKEAESNPELNLPKSKLKSL